jgi:hypothetical protein
MMVAVAIMGIALGPIAWMQRRAARFRQEVSRHLKVWLIFAPPGTKDGAVPRATFHWQMAKKYEQAARLPFLPIAPDPPEPK